MTGKVSILPPNFQSMSPIKEAIGRIWKILKWRTQISQMEDINANKYKVDKNYY